MQNSVYNASAGTHKLHASPYLFYLVQEIEKLTANKADTPDAQQFPVPHKKLAGVDSGLLLHNACQLGSC